MEVTAGLQQLPTHAQEAWKTDRKHNGSPKHTQKAGCSPPVEFPITLNEPPAISTTQSFYPQHSTALTTNTRTFTLPVTNGQAA